MTNTKKNKKNKKWVLALALLLAGVIAVGGTFAWFTSKDEVTNRLTASGSYGVSITETFTPPEQWTPGQSVTKEVAAVNTGNTAAYLKIDLTDALSVTKETGVTASSIGGSSIASTVTAANGYVVLTEDEVISLEAGGQLVYMKNLQKVVKVVTDASTQATTTTITYQTTDGTEVDTTVKSGDFYQTITTTGLYVFERTDATGTNGYTYVGYYVDASDLDNLIFYKVDLTGFSFSENQNGGAVTSTTNTSSDTETTTYDVKRSGFSFVKEETYSTAGSPATATITFSGRMYAASATHTSAATSKKGNGYVTSSSEKVYYIQAVYDSDGTSDTGDEIIVNIALDGKWTKDGSSSPKVWKSDNWTGVYDSANDQWTFYYNHILSAGTTSELLVTDMQLDTSVTNEAYNEFTYDLIVGLESVQVVTTSVDDNGIGLVQIPSSSITWVQSVSAKKKYNAQVGESGSRPGGSAANDKLIYVNQYGQVCVSTGEVKDKNNALVWSFTQ